MAWCRQATSHYLSQCWPIYLSPYGVTRPQKIKEWGSKMKCLPPFLHLLPWLLNMCLGTCSHYSLDWRNTTNLDPDWTPNLWPNVMGTLFICMICAELGQMLAASAWYLTSSWISVGVVFKYIQWVEEDKCFWLDYLLQINKFSKFHFVKACTILYLMTLRSSGHISKVV